MEFLSSSRSLVNLLGNPLTFSISFSPSYVHSIISPILFCWDVTARHSEAKREKEESIPCSFYPSFGLSYRFLPLALGSLVI